MKLSLLFGRVFAPVLDLTKHFQQVIQEKNFCCCNFILFINILLESLVQAHVCPHLASFCLESFPGRTFYEIKEMDFKIF